MEPRHAGNLVQPSDSRLLRPLLTVQNLDPVRIVVEVPFWFAVFLKREMPVEVEMPWVHGRVFKISRMRPSFDDGVHNDGRDRITIVEIDMPNVDNQLVSGMIGEVNIQLKKSDGLQVPSACVLGRSGQPYVYIVRDNKARRTPIAVSLDNGKEAEIAKGITKSDLIAVSNLENLEDGTPVKTERIKGP